MWSSDDAERGPSWEEAGTQGESGAVEASHERGGGSQAADWSVQISFEVSAP